uniref:Uncharacterized protein n=1 Tax=Globodera rostochiensis TaxID=31243 RepID=A0A914HHT6_GLORO
MSDHPNVQQRQLRKIYISDDDLLVVRQKIDGNGAALVKIYGRDKPVEVPFPLQPPPDYLIGFTRIAIRYIDHNVIAFLNCIRRLFDTGVVLSLEMHIGLSQMWESSAAVIWPLLSANVIRLSLFNRQSVVLLRRRVSPTVLRDCPADDSAEASFEQALSKWLHTARTDGRPKVFKCCVWQESAFRDVEALKRNFYFPNGDQWCFGEASAKAKQKAGCIMTACVSFIIRLHVFIDGFEPFELENGRTWERLALRQVNDNIWLMKRGPITATAGDWKRWAEWEREALEWNLLNRNLVVIDV